MFVQRQGLVIPKVLSMHYFSDFLEGHDGTFSLAPILPGRV